MAGEGNLRGSRALLPVGLGDLLPPDAAREAEATETLIGAFRGWGYARVKPPLVEFEDALLDGAGAAMATETFRVMDPLSQRMMGVRPDMTLQVARIASQRLGDAARPLRLSYAGEVLRVRGTQMRPQRGFTQVGAELIGASTPRAQTAADVEVVTMAAEALLRLGIKGLSVDLNLPTLVPVLLRETGVPDEARDGVRQALAHKDVAGVAALGVPDRALRLLEGLLSATGLAAGAVSALKALDLPAGTRSEADRLVDVAEQILGADHDFGLTLDPVEHRGFEYHAGVTFSIFAKDVRAELGRGGRYVTDGAERKPATGFTIFMDVVMDALPGRIHDDRVYAPYPADVAGCRRLREEGWVVVAGLGPVEDPAQEAKRLSCSHILSNGRPEKV